MATKSNRSAVARTVRVLRRRGRITDEHAGLVRLAETTAVALDNELESDAKRYVLAQLCRAHLLALQAFLDLPEARQVDGFDQLMAELSRPSWPRPSQAASEDDPDGWG